MSGAGEVSHMHFRVLGFWRVLAAFLVMVFHYLTYGPASGLEFAERMRSLMPLLDMFLMISGFLIMLRYADRLLVERGGYVSFLARRLARFYPLYLLTLVYFVAVAVAVHLGLTGSPADGRYDFAALPANLLLIQGWGFTDVLTFNYVGWTLSAEWFCYLTLPVVVLAYRRFGLVGLAALIAAVCIALEAAVAARVMPFESWMYADTWGAYRAFADFSIGAFLAALAERNNQDATLVLKPFDPLANASFSIYLIHPVVASLMFGFVWRKVLEPLEIMSFYTYWLAPMAVSVALALLSAHYFEAPLAKLLNERFANISSGGRKMARNAARITAQN